MNYLSYGDGADRTVLLIHGLCSTAELCYGPIVRPFVQEGYRVVLVEVDGHSDRVPTELTSLAESCDDIESYVERELAGELWCLGGFSMGATMAVELAGRGRIRVNRLFLDAPLTLHLGFRSPWYTFLFSHGTKWLQDGRPVPKPLLAMVMGEGNTSVVEMLYPRVSQASIKNACKWLYSYDIPEGLRSFAGPVLGVHGSREPYPTKSLDALRAYLPQLQEHVYPDLGHGQQLHENPGAYASELLGFLQA